MRRGISRAKRIGSRPTVSPGRSATARTAMITPGMKLSRESESWRMVSVSPTPPRITSWCATSPGRRTEWIGTSPSIRPAVRRAVPEGASSLPSWCSSTISARGMWRDASAAKRIISTAPTAKLGAITALAAPASASARSSSTCSGVRPVVPMTACTPAASAAPALAKTASGRVKSTSTSGPAPASAAPRSA